MIGEFTNVFSFQFGYSEDFFFQFRLENSVCQKSERANNRLLNEFSSIQSVEVSVLNLPPLGSSPMSNGMEHYVNQYNHVYSICHVHLEREKQEFFE